MKDQYSISYDKTPPPPPPPPPLPPPPPPPPLHPYRRTWKIFKEIMGVITFVVVVLTFLLTIFNVPIYYDAGRIQVDHVDVRNLYIEYEFLNTTAVTMSGNATISPVFYTNGEVNPFAIIATYQLTSIAIHGYPISSFARSQFSISNTGYDSFVIFDPVETTILPEKELQLFKQSIAEEPRVLVTCRIDYFQIQFGREEFCLVTGLKFKVENCTDYNNEEERIPFRHRVFSSSLDGKPIIGKHVAALINSEELKKLDDNDAVSLCCLGILQLVLLGLEDKRPVPNWILRLANDREG
ncbi:phospholipase-like protein [Tanacetum coccineum]